MNGAYLLEEIETWITSIYTEGVGQFQPRVALWQPWEYECLYWDRNPERVAPQETANASQPLQGCAGQTSSGLSPGLSKPNPGLKFANTFGVTLQDQTQSPRPKPKPT
jgi:hypothetical protein